MQRQPIALSPSTPWTLQLYDRLPFPDVVVGLLIAAVPYTAFLLFTGFQGNLGQLPRVAVTNLWQSEILLCLLIGIVPTVAALSIRGSLADLEALRPFLEAEGEDPRHTVTRYDRRLLRFAGASAFVGTFAFVYGDESLWTDGTRPALDDPDAIWLIARNLVNWWLVVRFMALELSLAHSFSRLGEQLAPLDLLDRTPLLVFGRRGLRSVLLWMLVVAFFSIMYAGDWASDILAPALVAVTAFAFAAFLLPVLGVRRQIRARKRAELTHLRGVIAAAREHVLRADAGPEGGRLADLLAWEGRVAATPEWPFDASTLARFALYLAIGLGSWVGAALVERALDVAL